MVLRPPCWGQPQPDSNAASEVVDALKSAAFALAFILLAVASHAADSLSIDLDRKLASFHMSDLRDADGIPVTRVTEGYIWFQNKALSGIYSQVKLDRITG